MYEKKWHIKLDVQKQYDNEIIQMIQQDIYSNVLFITLTNNGKLLGFEDVVFVSVIVDKPDGTKVIGSAEIIKDGLVKYVVDYQALAALGITTITLKIHGIDSIMATTSYYMMVIADPYSGTDGSIESTSEYPILTQMINVIANQAQDEIDREANETIRKSNETNRIANEINRQDNETIRLNNEIIRVNEEDIRIAAESNRVLNENGRVANETSRVNDESIRQINEIDRANAEQLRIQAEIERIQEELTRAGNEEDRIILKNELIILKTQLEDLRDHLTSGDFGDMYKAIYDTNNNGKVDIAENAEKLEGKTLAEIYADIPEGIMITDSETNGNIVVNNEEIQVYDDSEISNTIGPLASLNTNEQSNLVEAINEVDNRVKTHEADLVSDIDGVHGLQVESGVFSPVLYLGGASLTVEYASRAGVYTKIGKRVYFTLMVKTSTWTHSGNIHGVLMGGLPFPIQNSPAQDISCSGYIDKFIKAGYTQIVPLIRTSVFADAILFYAMGSNQTPDYFMAKDVPSGTNIEIFVSGSYLTN